jgi:hypothetical protein
MTQGTTELAAGWTAACAIVAGQLVCWGATSAAILRDAGADAASAPPGYADLGDAGTPQRVDIGGDHTCVLDDALALYCGAQPPDGYTYCGKGTTPSRAQLVLAPVASFSASNRGTCLLDFDAGVSCCGDNEYGQLGNGRTSLLEGNPLPVVGLRASALALGSSHGCAIDVGGTLVCWGSNATGQLGNPNVDGGSTAPVPVLMP